MPVDPFSTVDNIDRRQSVFASKWMWPVASRLKSELEAREWIYCFADLIKEVYEFQEEKIVMTKSEHVTQSVEIVEEVIDTSPPPLVLDVDPSLLANQVAAVKPDALLASVIPIFCSLKNYNRKFVLP